MKSKFYIGMAISVFNLIFYAIALDLLFHSGIFLLLFGLDLVEVSGNAKIPIGLTAIGIAIIIEVISYRVIRRGVKEDYHQSISDGSDGKAER